VRRGVELFIVWLSDDCSPLLTIWERSASGIAPSTKPLITNQGQKLPESMVRNSNSAEQEYRNVKLLRFDI
jgi:hypothetical protein